MVSLHNTFEGYADGATITTATSGGTSGDPFDVIQTGAGTVVASTSSPLEGSVSAVLTGGTATAFLEYDMPAGITRLVARRAFKFAALPATTYHLLQHRNTSSIMGAAALSTAGKCVARIGSTTVTSSTSTWVMSLNTLYYVEVYVTPESSTGAANGTIGYRILAADGTTEVAVFTATGQSTGTAAPSVVRFSDTKATGAGYTSDKVDGIQVKDLASGWIGPYVAQPTANAGPDQAAVEPYATVTLNGTGSRNASGGTTGITYAWTQTAGTTVTLSSSTAASPTFTAPATLAGDVLTFSLVVTETATSTASAADIVNVDVAPHTYWRKQGGTLHPVRIVMI